QTEPGKRAPSAAVSWAARALVALPADTRRWLAGGAIGLATPPAGTVVLAAVPAGTVGELRRRRAAQPAARRQRLAAGAVGLGPPPAGPVVLAPVPAGTVVLAAVPAGTVVLAAVPSGGAAGWRRSRRPGASGWPAAPARAGPTTVLLQADSRLRRLPLLQHPLQRVAHGFAAVFAGRLDGRRGLSLGRALRRLGQDAG